MNEHWLFWLTELTVRGEHELHQSGFVVLPCDLRVIEKRLFFVLFFKGVWKRIFLHRDNVHRWQKDKKWLRVTGLARPPSIPRRDKMKYQLFFCRFYLKMQIPNIIYKYFNDFQQYLIPLDGLFVSFFFLFMLIVMIFILKSDTWRPIWNDNC